MTAESSGGCGFHTTRWTQVIAAQGTSPDANQALRDLCAAYYVPVELFVRRYRGTDDARDLTHEFFVKLLEGLSLRGADRAQGRFRSYLLGAVRHFLADCDDRQRAARRGGGQKPLSLDHSQAKSAEDRDPAGVADPRAFPPDEFFDRNWALAVVESAIGNLRGEAFVAGEVERFDVLKHWLLAPAGHETAIEAARALNISDGAFKVAVHRLRKRFRDVVKSLIADTVDDPAELADELNYLIRALVVPVREVPH
jgi:DNA-directed RNA polymerase specialized sigma24 family protein